jgi:hypothetical protein
MSAFSPVRRAAVTERAGYRCEYCHLPIKGQVATFPIDHVLPKSLGGSQELENLALTCPHCNAQKWTETQGFDPETGTNAPLYNPRVDDWDSHFRWSRLIPGQLDGITSIGRATISQLKINDASMIELRCLLAELELFTG